jgi:hypothetical protein
MERHGSPGRFYGVISTPLGGERVEEVQAHEAESGCIVDHIRLMAWHAAFVEDR